MEASLANESIHLGSTLYGSPWWGGVVNPEAKLLLLSHCFDACGYHRVKIQTDLLNTRSQAAIAKLGAQREGVLRGDMKREDGTWRDTVVFSVLADEWPDVKAGLRRAPQRLSVHVTRTAQHPAVTIATSGHQASERSGCCCARRSVGGQGGPF